MHRTTWICSHTLAAGRTGAGAGAGAASSVLTSIADTFLYTISFGAFNYSGLNGSVGMTELAPTWLVRNLLHLAHEIDEKGEKRNGEIELEEMLSVLIEVRMYVAPRLVATPTIIIAA